MAATVKAMAAAGCSAEQIADVVAKIDEERREKARAGNAERQRRWRERNANNAVMQRDNALCSVTERDEGMRADVPAPACEVITNLPSGDNIYIKTNTSCLQKDREISVAGSIEQTRPGKPKRAKPRTSLAEDAQPDEVQRRDAAEAGMNDREFRDEWRAFRDHHRSKGNLMADWRSAWRTWLRGRARFAPSRAGPASARSNGGGYGDMLARLRGYISDEQTDFDDGGAVIDADPIRAGPDPLAFTFAIGDPVDQGGGRN